jgi:hypothetical protein
VLTTPPAKAKPILGFSLSYLKHRFFSIATTDAQLEKPGIEESIGMIRLLYSKRGNGKK